MVKNLPAMQETRVQCLGWEDALEEEMATYSTILTWRTPWTEEPGGSWGGTESDTTELTHTHTHTHTHTGLQLEVEGVWGWGDTDCVLTGSGRLSGPPASSYSMVRAGPQPVASGFKFPLHQPPPLSGRT